MTDFWFQAVTMLIGTLLGGALLFGLWLLWEERCIRRLSRPLKIRPLGIAAGDRPASYRGEWGVSAPL